MKTYQLEKAVVAHFRPRVNLIVPNVSWGFGGMAHEADLMVCTPTGCLYEIELKVSKSDLRAELRKHHNHEDSRIKHLWFAVPIELADFAASVVDPRFGVFSVKLWNTNFFGVNRDGHTIHEVRPAKKLSDYRVTEKERNELLRLCALRVWGLKAKLGKIMDRENQEKKSK